jgi:hypothetical protein
VAEISKEYLLKKRADIQDAIIQFNGALAMVNELLTEFYPEQQEAEIETPDNPSNS